MNSGMKFQQYLAPPSQQNFNNYYNNEIRLT